MSMQAIRSCPLCVLIHGIGSATFHFQLLGPTLAQAGYQVLMYDLLGRGHTKHKAANTYDLEDHLAQLRRLIEELGFAEQPHVVIAHSMGGIIATQHAATQSACIGLLTLIP